MTLAVSPAELQERRDLILALLEERAYSTTELARVLVVSNGAIAALLRRLTQQQQVHRGAEDRWRLGPRPAAVTLDMDVLEEDRGDDREDDGDELIERPALRQPAPSTSVAADLAPSWWVGLNREEFVARAAERRRPMRGAKENHFVPFRILQ